jgi:hypothetical protein
MPSWCFFQNNPNAVDRIEELLTKFYHEADDSDGLGGRPLCW